MLNRAKTYIRELPDKKRYLDFFTAVLTVPILLTVIITNVGNIRKEPQETIQPSTAPTIIEKESVTIIKETNSSNSPTEQPVTPFKPESSGTVTPASCKKQIGPVSIVAPQENEIIEAESLCFDIEYADESYCPVEWSYRINNSSWSSFTDSNVCLLNLSSGEKKFELRVKSTESAESTTILRTVQYKNPAAPSPTAPQQATPPADLETNPTIPST